MPHKCPCCNLEIPEAWSEHGGWNFSIPVKCDACKAPMKRVFDKDRFVKFLVFVLCQFCLLVCILPGSLIGLTILFWTLSLIAVFKQSIRYVATVNCTDKKIRY
jgi:hypothetical protein